MSARNYLSSREKCSSTFDCLPNINQQKFSYKSSGSELPPLSANTSSFVNRNLGYSYEIQPYISNDSERAGTPFSDFFSESETGTPDIRSEESDSSSGSALRRNTAEATRALIEEWNCIERTLFDEDGQKSMRHQILDECKQWRALHPQLRIVGKAIAIPEKKLNYRPIEYDEVIAMHYSDYEQYSESEERLSQSSTDVTPENSPRVSICDNMCDAKQPRELMRIKESRDNEDVNEPKFLRDKVTFLPPYIEEIDLPDTFSSLLHITPIHIRSPSQRRRQNMSILNSEIASSRWMRHRPDSSVNCDRNSAKSFVSLDTRNYGNLVLSATDRSKMINSRVVTARHKDLAKLEPLYTPDVPQNDLSKMSNVVSQYNMRKVSLPPLMLEEERKKVSLSNSAKKSSKVKKCSSKTGYQFDRVRH